jgi:hypothetical protein
MENSCVLVVAVFRVVEADPVATDPAAVEDGLDSKTHGTKLVELMLLKPQSGSTMSPTQENDLARLGTGRTRGVTQHTSSEYLRLRRPLKSKLGDLSLLIAIAVGVDKEPTIAAMRMAAVGDPWSPNGDADSDANVALAVLFRDADAIASPSLALSSTNATGFCGRIGKSSSGVGEERSANAGNGDRARSARPPERPPSGDRAPLAREAARSESVSVRRVLSSSSNSNIMSSSTPSSSVEQSWGA